MVGLVGCQPDYVNLPTFSPERKLLQAVIETPAGTNHEMMYDPASKEFRSRQHAGTDYVIEFLPFPGNYGFIPGTYTTPTPSFPVGKPQSVLVLTESQPSGTVLEILPIGLLILEEGGVLEKVILAVPSRPSQQILPDITTWAALRQHYPAVQTSLRLWFMHHGQLGAVHIVGWKDEHAAEQQVREAMQ
ncbi:inorganic diphosphatase [Hymenobacter sp. GOD-10R]|uniref:inorganic diphosphatase n=1 Tax=Hymenobacter sp. GOD-10R TaxID=3093922 RepID=UPI002D788500|nr:inorganic diphosphatase [Hymenobacter sp. GOD-10R]WRQ29697.1 inorganic diphosphatase [Hymenobacter sp. GOD-10R]